MVEVINLSLQSLFAVSHTQNFKELERNIQLTEPKFNDYQLVLPGWERKGFPRIYQ